MENTSGTGAVDHSWGATSLEMTRPDREVRLDHPKEKVQGSPRHQGMTGELISLITRSLGKVILRSGAEWLTGDSGWPQGLAWDGSAGVLS